MASRKHTTGLSQAERWRPVLGFEGRYEVSDCGRVRILAQTIIRKNGWRLSIKERLLNPYKAQKYGYRGVTLSREGRHSRKYVHTLVLEAFVSPRPAGLLCNHIDANPANNRLDNLEWTTQAGNMQHAARLGRINPSRGEASPHATVTEAQVRMIRRMSKEGSSERKIAAFFGIKRFAVRCIIKRISWRHVPED